MKIQTIHARQIFDSRGNPTVEVEIALVDGSIGRAAVPSGASTGEFEAVERRDGGKAFGGQGVSKVLETIEHKIAPLLIGVDATEQEVVDHLLIKLDGSKNKQTLGANATFAISLALARAAAASLDKPLFEYLQTMFPGQQPVLPMPMCNVFNGGAHALGSTDIQEFMVVPTGAKTFSAGLQMVSEVYQTLRSILREQKLSTLVGDEGGFAPEVKSNQAALNLIMQAIHAAGYKPGVDISLALDVAASELYHAKTLSYTFAKDNVRRDRQQLLEWYKELFAAYPIVSLEDGLEQNDWSGWRELVATFGKKQLIVGDDLLVTNAQRVQNAIDLKAATAVLVKPNQIGTLSETIETIRLAQANNLKCIVSHRSGETEDTFIAHLAVASGCGLIKTGSIARGERTAKYNELLRIAEQLASQKFVNPFAR